MSESRLQGIRAAEMTRQLQLMERTVLNLVKTNALSRDDFSAFCNRIETVHRELKKFLNDLGLEVDFKGAVMPKNEFDKSLDGRGVLGREKVRFGA
jgi:heme oxygenase